MTPNPHSDDPIADAEAELAAAIAHSEEVEDRYAEGEDVPATVFEQADTRKSMAQRAVERAKRLVVKRKEIEHEEKIDQLDADIAKHHSGLPDVRAAYQPAVEATRVAHKAITAYQDRGRRLEVRANRLGVRRRVTTLDGTDWIMGSRSRLLSDAVDGYTRTPRTSFMSDSHALAPELFRLLGTRAALENTLVRRYRRDWEAFAADEPQKAARLEKVRARLAELGEDDDQ